MGKPGIYDIESLIQAGIDPKTGLPRRMVAANASKSDIKRILRIKDEQTAINRYQWYNLPCDLTSQELERLIYYKYNLCMFYMKETEEFYFMPFALEGTIDFYGRFNAVHPVPMSEGTTEDDKKRYHKQLDILSKKHLTVVKGLVMPEDITKDMLENSCVILKDYTNQLSQTGTPRQTLNDGLLDIMADCVPFMHTSLLHNCGVDGLRVNNADEKTNVDDANSSIYNAALKGDVYMPMVGAVEFQELSTKAAATSDEFMMAMQSLDNFRLSTYGLENNGVFNKTAHTLQSEQSMNSSNNMLIYQDGLTQRQNFCLYANALWGLGIWCEPSENAMMQDMNGDGMVADENPDGHAAGVDGGNEDETDA